MAARKKSKGARAQWAEQMAREAAVDREKRLQARVEDLERLLKETAPAQPQMVEFQIADGAEGTALYANGFRLAGPKPWGNARPRETFSASQEDLLRAIVRGFDR